MNLSEVFESYFNVIADFIAFAIPKFAVSVESACQTLFCPPSYNFLHTYTNPDPLSYH